MTAISNVTVHIITGNRERAGTDERVWLGLGGQEFELDSVANDFERGSDRTYILGHDANIRQARDNDPRHLTLEEIQAAPVYMRVGDPATPGQAEATQAGHGDVITRAANLANSAGAALRAGIMHTATAAHSYWSSGNWNLQAVTVTVQPESGAPLTFSAPQAEDGTWLGGHGEAKRLDLVATA